MSSVQSSTSTWRRYLIQFLLVVWLVISVLPLLWALSNSFKPVDQIFTVPPQIVPDDPTLTNFRQLADLPFVRWLVNSLLVALVGTAGAVFFSALAGYGFAKFRFRGRVFLLNIVLTSLMVPFAVILIPLFVFMVDLGLGDSYIGLILPWLAPAFGIVMMRQFIVQSVPSDLLEAARLDGASEFAIFIRVVIPLVRPALGALAVWNFLTIYSNFIWPLTLISSPDKTTVPLGLNSIYGNFSREYGLVMAGAVIAALPTLIAFVVMRRQLISGLTVGALKG